VTIESLALTTFALSADASRAIKPINQHSRTVGADQSTHVRAMGHASQSASSSDRKIPNNGEVGAKHCSLASHTRPSLTLGHVNCHLPTSIDGQSHSINCLLIHAMCSCPVHCPRQESEIENELVDTTDWKAIAISFSRCMN